MTRRPSLRRLASLVGLLALVLALQLQPASAGRAWCRTDPVVLIDGEIADVFISAPLTALLQVTGPNEIVLVVPEGVRAKVVLNDLGFGRGTRTTIKESNELRRTDRGIEVEVRVRVPAKDDDMPVRVEFAPRLLGILWPAKAEGTANEWVTLRTEF